MKTLRKLLFPFSPLYAAGVWLRNYFYDRGWIKAVIPNTPVLCVGNLSVGGTGKTPMVELLLTHYSQKNRKVAVLSRGYGRKTKGFYEVTVDRKATEVGDEPLQIKLKFPGLPVVVDENRIRGIQQLEKDHTPELVILDDGFQHRKIVARKSILLTAWGHLYPDQTYLPAGDLRDHRSQARRADLILVTKCPEMLGAEERKAIHSKISPLPHQELLFSTLTYDSPRSQSGVVRSWELWAKESFTLVTGIANPESLVRFLKNQGLHFMHLSFSDHHNFTPEELSLLKNTGRILTTEKDATRLRGLISEFFVVGVRHHLDPEQRSKLTSFLDAI